MSEFKKIDLGKLDESEPDNQRVFTSPLKTFKLPQKKFGVGFCMVIGIILLGLLLVYPVGKIYSASMRTQRQAKKAWEAIKKQNVELASTELIKTKEDLKQLQQDLSTLSILRFIPVLNFYYGDADHLVKAGGYGLDAASILVDSLKPYADVLGLKGQGGSFVMGSAEDRIKTAVLTMAKITPRIDDVSSLLLSAQEEIDQVNPNHSPPFFGGEKIRKQLITVRTFADEGVTFVSEARPLVKVLPSLLGESKDRKYLILFQNDKELRPTGGFMTAYAVFRIEKGVIHVDRSEDIYNLDNSLTKTFPAPDPILKYLPNVPNFNIRDTNLSPDFVESMNTFNSLYKFARSKTDVDGIIALDTHVLVSIINKLDDRVDAAGIAFTTKQDKRCDCPQVIYELEDNITRPVGYEKEGRKDILGALLYSIMEKALKSSPKLYWGPLFQQLLDEVSQKHILFYLYDKDAQSGIEALNAAGRIKAFDGDYLHINEANMGGAKSNLFTQEAVTQNIETDNSGTITKTITINYKNPHPPSDCNLERGGLCINATFRDWIRIYVPKGSTLVSSQGSEVKVTTAEDLGKTVFEGFLTVRPLGTAVYNIKYTLPFKAKNNILPLLIQKQPGTDKNEYIIKVNGTQKEKFGLLTDKTLTLNL